MKRKWGVLLGAAAALLGSPAAGDDDLRARADAGEVEAQFELARRYTTGANGTPKDAAEAARWFRLAAEQGSPHAQVNLAGIYEEGRGVPRDDAEAVNWLVKAADQGHPRATYKLGERFHQGRGVPRSRVIAYMWLDRAAKAGSPAAQFRARALEPLLDPDERNAAYRLGQLQRQRSATTPDTAR